MSLEKNYKENTIEIMADAIAYCASYGLALNFIPTQEKIIYEVGELKDDEVSVYFNIDYLCEIIDPLDVNTALEMIYITIFSRVGEVLSELFKNSKAISKLSKDENEIYIFACSFCEKYTGVKKENSALRTEIELIGEMWNYYKNAKGKIAMA